MHLADCFEAMRYARMWAAWGDFLALHDARVMYALCINDDERQTLRVAFMEGVRDYVCGDDIARKVSELIDIRELIYLFLREERCLRISWALCVIAARQNFMQVSA